jgi:hypothetical protein
MKPMKNKAIERIDLAVAGINAMAAAIQSGELIKKCPYGKDRGIIMA